MISILIPVYNTDVRPLVSTLTAQIQSSTFPYEIILLDDGSAEAISALNQTLCDTAFVSYHANEQNEGRTRARLQLASLAIYPWLLFLDDDGITERFDFLDAYAQASGAENVVVCGGRDYPAAPADCKLRLHWQYGRVRERRWRVHGGQPRGFQTNNFLIHHTVFNRLTFPEALKGYGHEDTWIGMQLERLGVTVKQINDPVIHLGLIDSKSFIAKSEQALYNLQRISEEVPAEVLSRHVTLYRIYLQLKKLRLLFAVSLLYQTLKNRIFKNLGSCHPRLFFFDLYRLYYFSKICS